MRFVIILFILSTVFGLNAQLVTYVHPSPIIGVGQSEFLGPNYTIVSSTFTGNHYAIGHFDATNTTLGVSKGLFLTTGAVDNGFGPHGPNDLDGCSTVNGFQPDIDLSTAYLNGVMPYDMAKLEIEFIPSIDSIKIRFVFGSDEYPNASFSQFNDFFAVRLIKDDSIMVHNNIAILPTGLLVSINNVSNGYENNGPCNNCAHYQQNGTGKNKPYISDPQYIQYDGFTKDTYINADNLEIGSKYKMVMYIADVGDELVDSGVFIESCETCDFKLGERELENSNYSFKVYPNPAKETVTIESEIGSEYSLLDAKGRVLLEGSLNQNLKVLSLNGIQAGVYVFHLNNGDSVKSKKLIVE